MKNIFSINLMTQKFELSAKRFPVTVLLIAGYASLLFAEINNWKTDISFQYYIFFSLGVIISITATLWLENMGNYLKQHIITAVIILLWGVYCFFLPAKSSDIHHAKFIKVYVIGAVAFLAMFFISFLKKDKDKAFWNFSIQALFQIGLAALFGIVIFGGLALAIEAIKMLFNITIADKVFGNLAVFSFVLFAPLYFLSNIPDKIVKYNEEITLDKFLKIFALYILTPLATVYAVILYLYLFKIILAWELPSGWVSWLVSAFALVGLVIITLLYPVRLQEKNKIVLFLSRYYGLIILPLLVLMTIGIFRRIGDYGITINRCYVLLLNIWFYGIYIYLFITKSQRIKWIFISFATITLIFSTGFWSIPNTTKRILTTELNNYFDNQKISLSDRVFFDNLAQNKMLIDKLIYLLENYGKESIQPFFCDNLQNKDTWEIRSKLVFYYGHDGIAGKRHFSSYTSSKLDWYNEIWSFENFNTFTSLRYNTNVSTDDKEFDYSFENNQLTIKIPPNNRVFSIPFKEIALEVLENKAETERTRIFQGKDYTVLINEYYGWYYKTADSIFLSSFSGYLFYNK